MAADAPDVVYMLREGLHYEELRYSLRSLVNLPHGRVWIFGARPRWLSDRAIHIPVRQGAHKHANTARAWLAIADTTGLSPTWYLFHDDMYITAPVNEVPRLYRSTWQEWRHNKHAWSRERIPATEQAAASVGLTIDLCYEIHVPMVIDHTAFRDAVAAYTAHRPDVFAHAYTRTLYGTWVGYGGERVRDPKWRTAGHVPLPPGPFASSEDWYWEHSDAGQTVRDMFRDPSPYERTVDMPDTALLTAGHLAGVIE